MIKNVLKRFIALSLSILFVFAVFPVMANAATDLSTAVKDLGVSYTEGDTVEWSLEGGNIVGSVKATTGCSTSAASTTLTLTNKKTVAATLSFDYEASIDGGTITVDGNEVTANGGFSKTVDAGSKIEIALNSSATANQVTKITLKSILLYDPTATANVTFVPATDGGSYTVDGEKITIEVSKQNTADHGYELIATPADGYRFYGWLSNGVMISGNSKTVMHLDSDQTITAMFVDKSLPTFAVEGKEFLDLNEAVTYAQENSKTTVVLVGDGTLGAGNYTIPAGITLLIPFDAKQTLYTTEPGYVKTAETQMAFRTLTLDDGAVLQVNGAISVGGKCYTSSSTQVCKPTGAYGHIKMADGSAIHLNSGAFLYAWGYVTGSGNVYAHSGANVYEFFQIMDWRGGSATSDMKDNEQKVFPFSQYYVQNVEAPVTFENGANETVRITVTAGGVSASAEISFMGEAGMFQLAEGSTVTKRYDPATDRMIFDMNGSAKLNGISMSNLPVIGTFSSNVYVLPINNNMTMNIHSGTMTLNQDTALLPGVQVIVDAGAELAVAEGVSLYVYDDAQWSKSYVWGSGGKGITQVAYSPSGKGSRTISDAVIDVNGTLSVNGAMYTTEGGADIRSSQGTGVINYNAVPGTAENAYQYDQNNSKYIAIPIIPAKLHNADGTYAETANAYIGAKIVYTDGKWVIPECGHKNTEIRNKKDATLSEDGYTGDIYCKDCGVLLEKGTVVPKTGVLIIWKNENGDVLKEEYVEKGTVPTYTGETPAKEGDKHHIYEFTGWDKEPAAATEDITYTAQFRKTGKNGLCIEDDGTYWLENGEHVSDKGLVQVKDENGNNLYYYFGEDGKAVKNVPQGGQDFWISAEKTNGLLPEWGYYFDENGIILHDDKFQNGIVDGCYYIDGSRVHMGMFKQGEDYYYAKSDGQLIVGREYYCERNNGLLPEGYYTFDENGKLIDPPTQDNTKNGIVAEDGSLFYYENGFRTHAGLIKIGDDYYYYVKTNGEVVHGRFYWISKTNGLMPERSYEFADDGRMLDPEIRDSSKKGIVAEGGTLYYYVDGLRTYAGLIEIDGSYYYVKTSGEVVHSRDYWITKTNDLMAEGSYNFDADGRITNLRIKDTAKNGIIEEDDSLYYYVDGLRTYAGLIEIDGSYYYVRTSGEVVHGRSYWITKTNGILPEKSYTFADDGKMNLN